jgi:hypothetical protein
MSSPARDAKFVAAIVVGVVGAGTFAGVSHDGRGGAAPEAPATTEVLAPSTSTFVASTLVASTLVTSTLAAEPALPDPVPTRAPVRSRGS